MAAAKQGIPSAITRFVRKLDMEVYLRREVARSLGTSVDALQQAAQEDPALGPTYMIYYNPATPLYLYTPADVALLRAWADKKWPHGRIGRTGRPLMWNEQERLDRRGRACQVTYLHRKSMENARAGHHEVAADYQRRADAVQEKLRSDHRERLAYKTRPQVRPA